MVILELGELMLIIVPEGGGRSTTAVDPSRCSPGDPGVGEAGGALTQADAPEADVDRSRTRMPGPGRRRPDGPGCRDCVTSVRTDTPPPRSLWRGVVGTGDGRSR